MIEGKWNIWFAWQNTLPYDDNATMTAHPDGSLEVQYPGYPAAKGRWAEEAGMMLIRFDQGPGAVYAGNVALDSITGVMSVFTGANEFNGSWYAVRKRRGAAVDSPAPQNLGGHSPILGPESPRG